MKEGSTGWRALAPALALLAACGGSSPTAPPAAPASIAGRWSGTTFLQMASGPCIAGGPEQPWPPPWPWELVLAQEGDRVTTVAVDPLTGESLGWFGTWSDGQLRLSLSSSSGPHCLDHRCLDGHTARTCYREAGIEATLEGGRLRGELTASMRSAEPGDSFIHQERFDLGR